MFTNKSYFEKGNNSLRTLGFQQIYWKNKMRKSNIQLKINSLDLFLTKGVKQAEHLRLSVA